MSFSKLKIYEANKGNKHIRVSENYQEVVPDDLKLSKNSAILTQILSINGNFCFETDYKKV